MHFSLITIPYDSGCYNVRMGTGPSKLSSALVKEIQEKGHEVTIQELRSASLFDTEVTTSFELDRILAVRLSEVKDGTFPIILSGNCNTAIGTLSGLGKSVDGIYWFDCHGDFNTPETSMSGFFDGMALATLCGHCWKAMANSVPGFYPIPENRIALIGVRDLDVHEEQRLSTSAISVVTSNRINSFKPTLDVQSIYLHLDLDVLDPSFIKANSYAVSGGISPDQLFAAIKILAERYIIKAVAFTAYDPAYDPEGRMQFLVNRIINQFINDEQCG